MIRTYESRDLSVFQGLSARISVGKVLLQQIVSGEKIWENKKDLILKKKWKNINFRVNLTNVKQYNGLMENAYNVSQRHNN